MNLPRALWVSATAAVFALASGCDPSIPAEPPPPGYVVALFDPSAKVPEVPRPNDLGISAQTGLVELDDPPGASDAERAFNRYLRTLDGFPTAATAVVHFSGALEPSSLTAQTVRVFDLSDPEAPKPVTAGVTLTWDDAETALEIAGPWEKGRRYGVAVLGGEGGVEGEGGVQVVGAPAFVLVRAKKSLVTCEDLEAGDCRPSTALIDAGSPEASREAAVTLERARRTLQPMLEALEADGVARERLAAAWTFATVRQPLVTFDPANEVVPFPNELLMEDGHVALPIDPEDDALTIQLKQGLNQLDGFSTTASLLTEAGDEAGAADARLDASTLKAEQFLLVALDGEAKGEEVAVVLTCRACGTGDTAPGAEPDQVALEPAVPLREQTHYALLWRAGAKGLDGRALNAGTVFALARSEAPLVEDGLSAVPAVDDLTAVLLEPLRQALQPALEVADARGIPRGEILLAWTFRTQTTASELVALSGKPEEWALSTGVVGGPTALTDVDVSLLQQVSFLTGQDFHSHIQWAKEGEWVSGLALDPAAVETLPDGTQLPTEGAFTEALLQTPNPQTHRFMLVAPNASTRTDGSIPIVVFQHGLGRSRRDAGLIANTLARHGYATLSVDAPLHGLRSVCAADADCAMGTLCVDHRCPGGYAVGEGPLPGTTDPTETPLISGTGFVSTTNPFATRDHFRQQVLDLAQLLRVVQDAQDGIGAIDVDNPNTQVVERLDTSRLGYIGQSLGGIIGSLAVAVIPELYGATLNVPGASQTDIVLLAPAFQSQKQALEMSLAMRGIAPGSQAWESFLDSARWAMDPADPQNFTRLWMEEPVGPSPKRVFVSWILDDQVVPNATTQWLIDSVEGTTAPELLDTWYQQIRYEGGNHGFLLDAFNAGLCLEAQEDAVSWLEAP